jgi:hypothetical protein
MISHRNFPVSIAISVVFLSLAVFGVWMAGGL